ncbi:MAG: hypothetical protein ACK47B_24645 [Armatimonadota bacterium]
MKLDGLGEKNKTREIALLSAAVVALGYAATRVMRPAGTRSSAAERRQPSDTPRLPAAEAGQPAPIAAGGDALPQHGGPERGGTAGMVLASAGRDPFRPLPQPAAPSTEEETASDAAGGTTAGSPGGSPGVLPGPETMIGSGAAQGPQQHAVTPPAAQQIKLPPVPATLLGTMIGGDRSVAIFRRAGEELELQRGGKLGAYTVVEVRHNEVLVRKYGTKIVQRLYPGETTEALGKKRAGGSVRLTTGAPRGRTSAQLPAAGVVRVTIPAPQQAGGAAEPAKETEPLRTAFPAGVITIPAQDEEPAPAPDSAAPADPER